LIFGDFNGDGWLDVAATIPESDIVSVYFGPPKPGAEKFTYYPTGNYPAKIATADLDRDGNLDLVTVNYSAPWGVSMLMGNGDGSFRTSVTYTQGSPLRYVVIGDVNGDTVPDLVTDADDSVDIQVLLGKGDGTFALPVRYAIKNDVYALLVADVNGDARLDVIVTQQVGQVAVLLANANGTLADGLYYGTDGYALSAAVGDVNHDGFADLVVGTADPNTVTVMLGNGSGSFVNGASAATNGGPAVALADMNGDKILDVVTSESYLSDDPGNVGELLGNGDGTFVRESLYPIAAGPFALAIEDFGHDGKLDVAAASSAFDTTLTILSGSGFGRLADADSTPNEDCPNAVAVDVINDGYSALLTANEASSVMVYTRFGSSALSGRSEYSLPREAWQIAVGDLDNDGRADVVTHPNGSGPLSVYFGEGFAQLGQSVDVESFAPLSVALADVNSDGLIDIVTANQTTEPSKPYVISVNLNFGDRTFSSPSQMLIFSMIGDFDLGNLDGDAIPDLVIATSPGTIEVVHGTWRYSVGTLSTPYKVGGNPQHVKLADVNGDGISDAIVDDCDRQSVGVLLGQGDGTLGAARRFPANGCRALAVYDVNGDERPDIVTAGEQSSVELLLGNGDGTFSNGGEFGWVWVQRSMALGDLNGDGWTDLAVANPTTCEVSVLYGRCR
jgi:hypothetical protein